MAGTSFLGGSGFRVCGQKEIKAQRPLYERMRKQPKVEKNPDPRQGTVYRTLMLQQQRANEMRMVAELDRLMGGGGAVQPQQTPLFNPGPVGEYVAQRQRGEQARQRQMQHAAEMAAIQRPRGRR